VPWVKIFKGVTSLRLFKKFPELQQQLWHGVLGVLLTMLVLLAMSRPKPLKNIFKPNRISAIHPLVETSGLLSPTL